MRTLSRRVMLLLAALAALAANAALAADFTTDAVLEFTLAAPLDAVNDDRSNREEYDGEVRWTDAEGAAALPVEVRRRGKKRVEVCDVNPIRLDFPRGDTTGTPFAGLDKVKLVTHCERRESFQEYVLKEFLLYRIYAMATEQAFGSRLVRIDYRGTDDDRWDGVRWGFLIEPDELLAERTGLTLFEGGKVPYRELDEIAGARTAMYMYIVSNVDYSMIAGPEPDECCHNSQPTQAADGTYVPVPYDFDMTGAVDPPYAEVPGNLGVRSVRQRLYRGICASEDATRAARDQLLGIRAQAAELVAGFELLSERDRRRFWKYLDEGFEVLADERDFQREIVEECRG